MEKVGDTLLRMRLREFQRKYPPEPAPEPEPTCPTCKGFGYVRHDVPVDHPDFGRAFPCACRKDDLRDRLVRRSNLGPLSSRTFATFLPEGREPLGEAARHKLHAAIENCRAYAEAPPGWLVLVGPPGCGKTHLAAAVANRQIELGNQVFFAVVPDLLDHLRATYAPTSDVSYDDLFESIRNVGLLVLDDLGTQTGSPWAQEKLFQLLNHRFNAELPTVITTNRRLSELDGRLRARVEDKKAGMVVQVQEWESPDMEALLCEWHGGLREQVFENFKHDSAGLSRAEVESLVSAFNKAAEFAAHPEGWLVLVGDIGRGKTHLAAAIKNFRDLHGEPTLFTTVPRLLDYLRATYAPTSEITYDRGFEAIRTAPVLILDDYCAHSSTPWAEEKLFQLLNYRYNGRLPTVITTNIPIDRPGAPPPSQQPELRILSRLVDDHLSQVVRINAPDHRQPRRHGQERRSARG